ncbi:MAG: GGDEF domain-containing protein [Alphaproteobacteria bacterium]|nr:GGDEF domain-containing protein [Alphaproteobacteria bacterium]
MVLDGEIYQADLWSKQALERLLRDGLPPTPRNYAVCYEYMSGRNFALTQAFDKASANGKLTQQQCDEIYYKYVLFDDEKAFLQEADRTISAELEKVLKLLSQSAKETGHFGEDLDTFSGKLSSAPSLETLRDAVCKMAEETQFVVAQNAKLQEELAETSEQLTLVRSDVDRAHREAQIDALTEVGNRKFFDAEIGRLLTDVRENGTTVSLLMVDIDWFKKFNDRHGHLVGDQVLRLVAKTLVENLKGRDIIARYGGEEFVILLPDTRVEDAERVAEHLRVSLATKQITKRGSNEVVGAVTISIGVSEYKLGDEGEALVARADKALYEAKQTGRNRVVAIRA